MVRISPFSLARRQLTSGRLLLACKSVCTRPLTTGTETTTYEGALELLRQTTTRLKLASSSAQKQNQEEALAATLRSKGKPKVKPTLTAEERRMTQREMAPSGWLVNRVALQATTLETIQEVKAELMRLHSRKLFKFSELRAEQLVRSWILKGFYKEVAELIARPAVYGLNLYPSVKKNFMRALAIRADALYWNISHVYKISRTLKRFSPLQSADPMVLALALSGYAAMKVNTTPGDESPQAQQYQKSFDEAVEKILTALNNSWTSFPQVPVYSKKEFHSEKNYVANLNRSIIDYDLALYGLKTFSGTVTHNQDLILKAVPQVQSQIKVIEKIVQESGSLRNTTDVYKTVFLQEKVESSGEEIPNTDEQ
ncbi:hypothetical protein V1512DRAFT_264934 [Lipomyces arxii]|uniref:uncharacterized protein n=1 Tax=Lipomyces arxii TaxID=56418 RepID=UPI0034CFCB04